MTTTNLFLTKSERFKRMFDRDEEDKGAAFMKDLYAHIDEYDSEEVFMAFCAAARWMPRITGNWGSGAGFLEPTPKEDYEFFDNVNSRLWKIERMCLLLRQACNPSENICEESDDDDDLCETTTVDTVNAIFEEMIKLALCTVDLYKLREFEQEMEEVEDAEDETETEAHAI